MYYRRVVTSCGNSATSTAALVTVRANFTTGTIASTGQTVVGGGTPGAIGSTVAASGGGGTISYQWYKDGVAISGATAANYTPPASMTASASTYIYTRRAKDNTCNTTLTASVGSWVLKVTCPYTGSDLLMDATHVCQQRASGAKNWEAWIKDARDNKLYRIARLSTGLWTMDDYLNYKSHASVAPNYCSQADPTATLYWRHTLATTYTTLCPTGWQLPTQAQFERTINDWAQYLTKKFAMTGETAWGPIDIYGGEHCNNPTTYTSWIVVECLGSGVYGERVTSINPVSWLLKGCSTDPYLYSSYARCVR